MNVPTQELLTRGVDDVIIRPSLEKKLRSGRPLRVKHGVDPTTKDLHLGYAVIYEKLRQFQAAGHTIVFLIGGFTARFGDPTDRLEERHMRDRQEVEALARGYVEQLGRILDVSKVEIRSNAEWYDGMSAEELLRLLSGTSVQRMLERDMFDRRRKAGLEIGLHEITYPVLQGFDSVMLKSDLTVIGRDQTFNELQARPLQEAAGQAPQDLVVMPLLVGTDGKRKMSQSFGNSINFNDAPSDMFGKIMSLPDSQIVNYFTLVTRLPLDEISEIARELKKGANPRDAKAKLAHEIVTTYHSKAKAAEAAQEFDRVFKEKGAPSDIPTVRVKTKELLLVDLLVQAKLAPSKSEARRLVEQGAVELGGKRLTDPAASVQPKDNAVLKVGKRRFARVRNG
jgi:tyrosyl-tRNA synthetase